MGLDQQRLGATPRAIGPSWLSALLPVTVETEWVTCPSCLGDGAIASPRGSNPHAYEERDCEACDGRGEQAVSL